jgi:hypothetical protein
MGNTKIIRESLNVYLTNSMAGFPFGFFTFFFFFFFLFPSTASSSYSLFITFSFSHLVLSEFVGVRMEKEMRRMEERRERGEERRTCVRMRGREKKVKRKGEWGAAARERQKRGE